MFFLGHSVEFCLDAFLGFNTTYDRYTHFTQAFEAGGTVKQYYYYTELPPGEMEGSRDFFPSKFQIKLYSKNA